MAPEATLLLAESMLGGKLKRPKCLERIRALHLQHHADNELLEAFLAEVARDPDTYLQQARAAEHSLKSSAPECADCAMASISEPDPTTQHLARLFGPMSSPRTGQVPHVARKKTVKRKRGIGGFFQRLFKRG